MSLTTQIQSLASRIAAEFKTVRDELATTATEAGKVEVSTTAPIAPVDGALWLDIDATAVSGGASSNDSGGLSPFLLMGA